MNQIRGVIFSNKCNTVHPPKTIGALKWDALQSGVGTEDVIPMWVADMDLKAPDAVNEALMKRVDHGIYGYTYIDDSVKHSITNWLSKRHDWNVQSESLS